MNVLIVLAHPEPQSFNHALAGAGEAALRAAGHEVTVSDLHAERFDPVPGRHDFLGAADPGRFHYQSEQAHAVRTKGFAPDIAREQARLRAADLLVVQFPLWWGGVPAMLKGWIDRVLAYGFGYADGLRYETGVFRGRRAVLSLTTGGPPARFGFDAVYGDLESQVLWQIRHSVLEYLGYEVEPPFVAYAAPRVGAEVRQRYLDDFARLLVQTAAKPVDRSLGNETPLAGIEDGAWAQNR